MSPAEVKKNYDIIRASMPNGNNKEMKIYGLSELYPDNLERGD
jgi:hypothetical protein